MIAVNLLFTKIKLEDLEFLNHVRNSYAESFLHDSRQFTVKQTIDWYKKNNPDYWIIFDQDINQRIGYFRLHDHSILKKNIYIGADIDPKFTNKGYASEAYKQFIPFLFKNYNLHKISLEVLSTNYVAIKLYEKLGFIKEGEKIQEVFKKNKWVNSIMMSFINPNYKIFSIAIALHVGKRKFSHNAMYEDSLFFLKKQIEYINKLNISINKVYLIFTFSDDVDKNQIIEQINLITNHDNKFVIKFKQINIGGSYTSWHYALDLDDGTSDYLVLIEDDYVLYNTNSINQMEEYFNSDKDLFFLCSKYEINQHCSTMHASVSNGMINNKMYQYLKKNKKIDFYFDSRYNQSKENENVYWNSATHNQKFFLKHYQENEIKIKDFSDKFSVPFYETSSGKCRECGVEKAEMIFCPIIEDYIYRHNKFLILIFYYERPKTVLNALKSINDITYCNFEVHVIDDGSKAKIEPIINDFCKEKTKEIEFKVTYVCDTVENKQIRGGSTFGKFANEAIAQSNADHVIVLCDDDAMFPGFLENLNLLLNKNPNENYFYHHLVFYDHLQEDFSEGIKRMSMDRRINSYCGPIQPSGYVDSSQITFSRKAFVEDQIKYPFPKTDDLDAVIFQQMYEKWGPCKFSGLISQVKSFSQANLGARRKDENAIYRTEDM